MLAMLELIMNTHLIAHKVLDMTYLNARYIIMLTKTQLFTKVLTLSDNPFQLRSLRVGREKP
jgi:hypothetical protein